MEENLYDPFNSDSQKITERKRFKLNPKKQENIKFLETPLSLDLKNYISKILEKNENLEEIIKIIENIAEKNIGNNLYEKLIENLNSFFDEESETKKIVGKILFYKSKSCKLGINCENISECVFDHDISNEVIVNKVPENISINLQEYCSNFGEIKKIKILNKQKFLVIFKNQIDALSFIKDRNFILDDENIKKFFNKKRSNLNLLFYDQEKIINSLFETEEKKIALKLRLIHNKIKNVVFENEK